MGRAIALSVTFRLEKTALRMLPRRGVSVAPGSVRHPQIVAETGSARQESKRHSTVESRQAHQKTRKSARSNHLEMSSSATFGQPKSPWRQTVYFISARAIGRSAGAEIGADRRFLRQMAGFHSLVAIRLTGRRLSELEFEIARPVA